MVQRATLFILVFAAVGFIIGVVCYDYLVEMALRGAEESLWGNRPALSFPSRLPFAASLAFASASSAVATLVTVPRRPLLRLRVSSVSLLVVNGIASLAAVHRARMSMRELSDIFGSGSVLIDVDRLISIWPGVLIGIVCLTIVGFILLMRRNA